MINLKADMINFYKTILHYLENSRELVQVTVLGKSGSTPFGHNAKMLVDHNGLVLGTIGGGAIERSAIEYAQKMLQQNNNDSDERAINLQKDLGMVCGGTVRLFFEVMRNNLKVAIFGAGHVAQSLIRLLLTIENCEIVCYDSRAEWLERLPTASNLTTKLSDNIKADIANLTPEYFVIGLTYSHRLDFEVSCNALAKKFKYVGIIGSKSKAIWLRKQLLEAGIAENMVDKIDCPIGTKIGNNSPAEVALSIVAQLLLQRDKRATV